MRTLTRYRKDASFCTISALERVSLRRLCEIARRLDDRHALPATSGNFSMRVNENCFLITRSGIHKRTITPRDFIRVDEDGKALHAMAPKPSDETLLHSVLYRALPKYRFILHCHAPEVEAARAPGVRIAGHELLKILGFKSHTEPLYLNTFPNSQDMNVLSADVERVFKASPTHSSIAHGIFVLENHGIYCGGVSIANAEAKLEAILHLLSVKHFAR